MKGQKCHKVERFILCQEENCGNCQIYIDDAKEKLKVVQRVRFIEQGQGELE